MIIFLISVGLLVTFLLLLVFQCLSVLFNETVETAVIVLLVWFAGLLFYACAQWIHGGIQSIAAGDGIGEIVLGAVLAVVIVGIVIVVLEYVFVFLYSVITIFTSFLGGLMVMLSSACEAGFCSLIDTMERSVEKKGARIR